MFFNPTNREEIRLKAIETASEILMRDGNLTMRMDDIVILFLFISLAVYRSLLSVRQIFC